MNRQALQKVLDALAKAGPAIPVLGLGLGAMYGASNALYNVEAGHRAIKFSRLSGISEETYEEGTHLFVPWLQKPIMFDIRAKPRVISSLTGSRDLQMVNISLRTLARPDERRLQTVYRNLGMQYDEKVGHRRRTGMNLGMQNECRNRWESVFYPRKSSLLSPLRFSLLL